MSKQRSQQPEPAITARQAAERLQLLFSWREALASRRGGAAARANKASERRAQREIDALRAAVQKEIEHCGAELQRVFSADQRRPGNVVIEEKLGQLRHNIRQLGHVLKADHSSDLGGKIELPVEHYPVELGLGRTTPAFRMERDDFITIVVAAVFILVSCLGIAWYNLWRENIAFHMERTGENRVAIHFRNESSFVAQLYGPWPESEKGLEPRAYGVRLYCRPPGSDAFQDCTTIRDAWAHQGQVISPLKPVQVEPGVSATIELYLDVLEKEYGSPVEAVRITGGSQRNQDDFAFEVTRNQ